MTEEEFMEFIVTRYTNMLDSLLSTFKAIDKQMTELIDNWNKEHEE